MRLAVRALLRVSHNTEFPTILVNGAEEDCPAQILGNKKKLGAPTMTVGRGRLWLSRLLLLLLGLARGYQMSPITPAIGRRCGMLQSQRLATSTNMLLEALPAPMLDFGSWYMHSLDVNPIQTKVLTAATLAMAGDFTAQVAQPGAYDAKRGLSFGLFDSIYRGGFQHFLFPVINDAFQGTILLSIFPAGNVLLLAALERTFANQLVVRSSPLLCDQHGPSAIETLAWCAAQVVPLVYYPLFFALTGLVQGLTTEEAMARARSQFVPLIKRNLLFWLPVQLVQFEFVPEELQARAHPRLCQACSRASQLAAVLGRCWHRSRVICPPHFFSLAAQVTWVALFGYVWKVILSSVSGNAKAGTACANDAEECLLPPLEGAEGVILPGSVGMSGAVVPTDSDATAAGARSRP